MAKKYKAVLSILLVVLIAVSVITVTGVIDINKIVKEHEIKKPENKKAEYTEFFASETTIPERLMKTDINNVFYTMTPEGEVKFYEASAGAITELPETYAKEITAECSAQKLTAQVHFLEYGEKTVGYGLFTNTNHPDVFLYDYAFFKVSNMFPDFKKTDLILMLDVDKNRFYSEEKIYSEIFYLSEEGKTETFLSEKQRVVDLNARLRTDYKMFTDGILDQEGRVYFFSSRYYTDYNNEKKLDILKSGGSGENVDNLRLIADVEGFYFLKTDEGVLCFVKTDTGFDLVLTTGEDDVKTIKSFEGSLETDYKISRDYILRIETGDVYSIKDNKDYKIDYTAFKMNFTPDLFSVSENGRYCIIRGANNLKKPAVGVMDFETGRIVTYTDNLFGYVASLNITDDGTAIISAATGESASAHYQLVGNMESFAAEETTEEE